jgi:hypothetical protein
MLALAAPRASLKPAPDATARSIASCREAENIRHNGGVGHQLKQKMLSTGQAQDKQPHWHNTELQQLQLHNLSVKVLAMLLLTLPEH